MIDFHGNAMTQHVANRAWDAAKWVAGLRKASRLSSREIYWKVWGLTHFLTCGECGEQFPVCELDFLLRTTRGPHLRARTRRAAGWRRCASRAPAAAAAASRAAILHTRLLGGGASGQQVLDLALARTPISSSSRSCPPPSCAAYPTTAPPTSEEEEAAAAAKW